MSLTIKNALITLVIVASVQKNSFAELDGSLHHFEVLHDEQVNHRITKRSLSDGEDIVERDVQFESLGKKFDLKLTKRVGLFSPGFKAYAIDKNNKQRDINVETKQFFSGYNKEEPWSSTVSAFWDEKNSMTARIKTKHEVYMIEPAWRHLDNVQNNSMIAYKESDLILDKDMGDKYCGFVNPELDYSIPPTTPSMGNVTDANESHARVKRQSRSFFTPTRTTCPLLLVSDYRFFETMGQSSLSQTTSYLIGLIDRVDGIYRATDFGKGFKGMGFEIKEIRVHEAPTPVLPRDDPKYEPHYNEKKDLWQTKKLLELFSADKTFRSFCLAHLFTHQPFDGGVLGLAYIASPRKYSVGGVCSPGELWEMLPWQLIPCMSLCPSRPSFCVKTGQEVFAQNGTHAHFCMSHLFTALTFKSGTLGLSYLASSFRFNPGGICSPVYYKSGKELYLNTGWSSSLNRYNRRLLTSEADLVTTHEFGHNWGSEHDPDTNECSPSSFHGGKFIMYTYSVSGYDQNNKVFSPCSKRGISAVLEAKHDVCFRVPSDGFCGNMRVEGKEECDPGPEVSKDNDPCCNQHCMLRPGKICSDVNSVCCKNCDYASSDIECHVAQNYSCEGSAKCTGFSEICPKPDVKDNNTECIGGGKCQDGTCVQFCESRGLVSCICDEVAHSCHRCCRDPWDPNSNCTAEVMTLPGETFLFLPNGVPCAIGDCLDGTCRKQVENLVERIWDIIETITTSNFVEFMRANIVGTVLVFSIVLWIPLSCIISCLDRKRRKEEEERLQWHASDNKELLSDLDRKSLTIRRAKHVRGREQAMYRQPDDNSQYVARALAPDRRAAFAQGDPGPPPTYNDYVAKSTRVEPSAPPRQTYKRQPLVYSVQKAYPPPDPNKPKVAPKATFSEGSYGQPDNEDLLESYELEEAARFGAGESVFEEPEEDESLLLISSSVTPLKLSLDTVDMARSPVSSTEHMNIVNEIDNGKITDGTGDATLPLPTYVVTAVLKGKTYYYDLPRDNLSKVQDFLQKQRKQLFRHYHISPTTPIKSPKTKDTKSSPRGSLTENTKVFGVNLEKLLERDHKSDPNLKLPLFISQLINHLSEHVTEEGILRKPGKESEVKRLKREVDESFYNGNFNWEDVHAHDAASLLKKFLKELPVKLLSTTMEDPDAFLKVKVIKETENQLKALHLLVLLISDVQRDTLRELLKLLRNITLHHNQNKMTLGNVASIMAPNLFPFDVVLTQNDSLKANLKFSTDAVQMLVKYQDILWLVPQFVMDAIRQRHGSQGNLLLPQGLSLVDSMRKQKVPQIMTEKYFMELVKVKVTVPHLAKSTAIELDENTTAQDILERFRTRSPHGLCLYEVGGNIDERKLPNDSHMLTMYTDNKEADWFVREISEGTQ